jgi:integrase
MELKVVSGTLQDMALLSLHCGLGAEEILGLSWSDVDFGNSTIPIKDTKSKRNRNAIMTSDVETMLDRWTKQTSTSEIVFQARDGNRITEISRAFDRAVLRLGFNSGIETAGKRWCSTR